MLAWARRILANVEALAQDMSETRGSLVGRLRMGVVPAALPMVTLLTTRFVDAYPRTTVTVSSATSVDIQRGLDDFSLDVGPHVSRQRAAGARPFGAAVSRAIYARHASRRTDERSRRR